MNLPYYNTLPEVRFSAGYFTGRISITFATVPLNFVIMYYSMAVSEGFEPSDRIVSVRFLSRKVPSASSANSLLTGAKGETRTLTPCGAGT